MKKILLLIIPFFTLLGCGKFLDVNENPNSLNISFAKEELIFPAAVENNASVFGYYVYFLGEIWSQHWTSDAQAPSFQQEDSYQVTAGEYDYDLGTWRNIYSGALMDYELVRKLALEHKNWTYYLMATVMQCYTYQTLVDLWDNIPMSDALKSHPPKFDTGKQVYDSIIARLDFALSKDLNAETCQKPAEKDLVFGGNMENWKAFANSLKLKIYLRQIYVNPSIVENTIRPFLESNPTFLTTDATFVSFKDEAGKDNYIYAREWRGGNTNIRASKTILEFLKDKNDLRYKAFFKPTQGSSYEGMYQGDFRNQYSYPGNQKPTCSSPRIYSTMPLYFMTVEEVKFMLAEAYMLLGNDAQAEIHYKEAIDYNFQKLINLFQGQELDNVNSTLPNDPASVYGNGKYGQYIATMSQEEKQELIITQKWIALTNFRSIEAFFEHNRTKYPREYGKIDDNYISTNFKKGYWLVSCTGVLPDDNPYPRRLIYPSIEQNKNSANVPPIKQLYEKVWWDVKVKPY